MKLQSVNLFLNQSNMLKSTQERLQRQEKASKEVSYWEDKKKSLIHMNCETVEAIAEKLNMLHTYEDQISAAKAAYNNEQMFHILDEAQEISEKIAEAAEDSKPKTAEERKKEIASDAVEAITGEDTDGGILTELLEDLELIQEQTIENSSKENNGQLSKAISGTSDSLSRV